MHLCGFLRWKTGYGQLYGTEAELADRIARNEVPFSCLKTQQTWGPDAAAALPEQCAPPHRCYEPSPELDRLRVVASAHGPAEDDDIG